MNRDEFMEQLEYLLSDIPEEEKEDALAYYRDYLEEAGEGAGEAIREFGSPERIASIIRSDLAGNLEEGGQFTDRGYDDERFRDPNYQVSKRLDLPEAREDQGGSQGSGKTGSGAGKPPYTSGLLKAVLWIILIIVAAPMLLGAGGVAMGIAIAVLCLLVGVIALVGVLTLTFLLGGLALCVLGIVSMTGWIPGGLLVLGVGVAGIGLGIIGLLLSILFYGRFLPWLIRGLIDLISRPIHRGKKANL